ncbi:nitroreductase/quinone reductase family protein [Egicoccus sp. AB-alg6-2]|uniref:nitroreductase/quinone reductase family protein n=1 Tax=Egicoccus sp. AB-alg6-2 TaxID=3242692 RepID=UPI00359DDCA1
MDVPAELLDEHYCLLSTQGRVTARRHTAELWFVPAEGGVYLMSGSGGLTQWCLNLQHEEQGVLRIDGQGWLGRASFLPPDDPRREEALRAFHDKYDPPGKDRVEPWMRNATVATLVLTRKLEP